MSNLRNPSRAKVQDCKITLEAAEREPTGENARRACAPLGGGRAGRGAAHFLQLEEMRKMSSGSLPNSNGIAQTSCTTTKEEALREGRKRADTERSALRAREWTGSRGDTRDLLACRSAWTCRPCPLTCCSMTPREKQAGWCRISADTQGEGRLSIDQFERDEGRLVEDVVRNGRLGRRLR